MDGNGHVHTGFLQLTVTAIYVIVFMQIVRLGAAKLADNTSTATVGKAIGGLVTFGGAS